jgi:hypothetical protein
MTRQEFEALPVGSWFHSKKFNQEYQIHNTEEYCHMVMLFDLQKNRQFPVFWTFEGCTNYDFEIGRYPDNLPKEAHGLFVNVLKDEDVVFVGNEIFQTSEAAYNFGKTVEGYKYTAKLVPVEIKEPFVPKHGEKCRVETKLGEIRNCIVSIIENETYALAPGYGYYEPKDIKQFLPL